MTTLFTIVGALGIGVGFALMGAASVDSRLSAERVAQLIVLGFVTVVCGAGLLLCGILGGSQ